ncbi:MAG TPA: glucosidase, partial [Terriglobales bacterium]|nr:glucosidase [Terriglobales bacterium]
MINEHIRLAESHDRRKHWKRWGSYLSERAWGTVREDYSANGDVWNYFTHEQSRSRTYRWNEDGLAGICDRHQWICFALALWNERDPYLKERLYGLTGKQGNHGEDVKECYFYLDNTPTHSYMKFLYKYPQAAFPYDQLLQENQRRGRHDPEYELLDTGVFNDDRYFDVAVEYAKADVEDILVKITVTNHGPEAAPLHVLPTLWFRNIWSWGGNEARPYLQAKSGAIQIFHPAAESRWLYCEGSPELLFTENESNNNKLFGSKESPLCKKDG